LNCREGKRIKAHFVSEKGRRQTQDDAHYLDLNFGGQGWIFGGIYDGHNGSYAARYAAQNLHGVFLGQLIQGSPPQPAFRLSYETIDQAVRGQKSGTTAVDFLIRENRIFTANAGDARALVINRNGLIQLTVDHRLDNPVEKERIAATGALINYPYVVKGNQGLMPTRAIGDEYFKSAGVIATPALNEYAITPNDLILISACDGLWDFISDGEVATMARQNREPCTLIEALIREVLINRQGSDNLTIMAVALASDNTG
jgi:serine/threonine protein phosphatase PrpC